ncbi:MAG: VTT domain-containing protein [Aquabacterium sp.]
MSDKPVAAARNQAWRWLLLCLYVAILVGLGIAWREPGMRHWLDPRSLSKMGVQLLATPLGPLAVIGGYVVAVMLGMPVLVLTSVGALIFAPWPGMAYALAGMLAGALVTYGIGRYTGAQTMDRWTKGRLSLLSRHLHRRGLVTVIIVRVLPLAPFIMVNMVAGALRVRMRDYVLGTCLGLLPATIAIFLLMDRITAVWRSPSLNSYAALAACVLALIVVFWWTKRKLGRTA